MSGSRGRGSRGGAAKKGAGRRNDNNKLYAYPLPLLLEPPPKSIAWAASILGIYGLSAARLTNPHCEGIFDPATRSVWISNAQDSMVLWRRGFFGKGNLSRSEPSWLARQLNARKARSAGVTAEEITAKRRAERKQFKLDRARAIAEAAREAEAVFAERGVVPSETSVVIPSAATWKPSLPAQESTSTAETACVAETPAENNVKAGLGDAPDAPDAPDAEDLEDREHLQLTLQEAFFLMWSLDCLSMLSPSTHDSQSVLQTWRYFHSVYYPAYSLWKPPPEDWQPDRFDNPFLINYVVYHHYRSLGWVVKGGIKFCVDYLLYKRGPVFQHAEFALVVCPHYEDKSDEESRPFALQGTDPMTWTWLSTINRVNSQVMKTLILVYVTIPAMSRLDPKILETPACLAHYSIREVIVRRFIPARMRD